MRTRILRPLALFLLLAPAAAWTTSRQTLELEPGSRLWVSGGSTVRGWQCEATDFDATVAAARADGVADAILAGEEAVTTASVTVPIEELDCKNGTMNDHMRKALKAKQFPTIAFALSGYDLAAAGDSTAVTLTGMLTLGGVEKEVTVQALAREAGADTLRVTGTHELKMTDYGLKPPSLMLGTMKVKNSVQVHFDLLLRD